MSDSKTAAIAATVGAVAGAMSAIGVVLYAKRELERELGSAAEDMLQIDYTVDKDVNGHDGSKISNESVEGIMSSAERWMDNSGGDDAPEVPEELFEAIPGEFMEALSDDADGELEETIGNALGNMGPYLDVLEELIQPQDGEDPLSGEPEEDIDFIGPDDPAPGTEKWEEMYGDDVDDAE